MEPWIETSTGKQFWYTSDDPREVDIRDIASALSKLCRFTGHCSKFYSVAEHSILVSELLPDHLKLAGLLHDASEAYLADIASPIKQLLPEYKKIEHFVMEKVGRKFGITKEQFEDKLVKCADWSQLKVEASDLLPSRGENWYFPDGLLGGLYPTCFTPQVAERMFLDTYYDITRNS